ncbi:PilN domain-containing protein [Pseudomonas mangrovi]|jgi:type IV pilus assembly protein PilN|uniref:Pilus assembly protein PilN n=1 Tax=Pseudomonas mangrovi TaxID=2161748 RepID=A0A2T5P592_9PSED|nr:PilN domain-containing protein [Pseudomonas mangrovi]PTU72903.1 pilus assembly protein PilN [Pseudomonas mangrovi]
MARINLLPWREQLREERKQRFLVALAGSLIVAGGLVFLGDMLLNGAIDNQNARNQFIRNEITVLESRIKEINELQAQRQQLIERMKIIQDLQLNRPVIARLFDQMTRTLPDGLYYESVKMQGKTITIAGAAESNNRVSELMRSMDASEWLSKATLTQVKLKTAGELEQANNFLLTVQQARPGDAAEKGVGK